MKFFEFFCGNDNLITAPHSSQERYDSSRIGSCDRGSEIIAREIFKELNFNLILPHFSRFIIDFNRKREESILNKFKSYEIEEVSDEEKEKRIRAYDEYYDLIHKIIKKNTIHVSIHTMTPFGGENTVDEGVLRPDFRIGTLNGKSIGSDKLKVFVESLIKLGFEVEVDNYFCGGEEVNFTSGKGMDSLQIEINTRYILDFEKNEVDVDKCKEISKIIICALDKVLNFDTLEN